MNRRDGDEQSTIALNEDSSDSDIDDLSNAMLNLSLDDYIPEDTTSDSSTDSTNGFETKNSLSEKRQKLNEFLSCCHVNTKIGPYKKRWEDASVRTLRTFTFPKPKILWFLH
jgi:hypothetical protein